MIHRSPLKRGHAIEPIQTAEDAPKISGPDNLSREGWDEEQCRNFLVRVLDWVPRNFNYEDGLTIIHPQLQERFGDENVDLACGVLHELIEVDEYNPFPASSYQRWKHTHRTRRENLLLPHVPHTATIMSQVIPTKTLLDWREKNNKSKSQLEAPRISPTSPTFQTGISTITHRSAWRIEHTLFVSTGGEKASVYHCPSPEEFHKRLWDPDYGRGGNLVSVQTHTFTRPTMEVGYTAQVPITRRIVEEKTEFLAVPSSASKRQTRVREIQAIRDLKASETPVCKMSPPMGFRDATYEELSSSRPGPKPGTKPNAACLSSAQNVPLPHGVLVPNAAFARKHRLVPDEVPLPCHLLKGPLQPTAKQLGLANAQYISLLAKIAVRQSRSTARTTDGSKEQDENLMREYFSYFKGPFTADLFYDGGLDFKWSTSSVEEVEYAIPVRSSLLSIEPRRRLFGLSPSKKSSLTSSWSGIKSKSKASTMDTSLSNAERRQTQIVTKDGERHLINSEGSSIVPRRFLSIFRRSTLRGGKNGRSPLFRGDTRQTDAIQSEDSSMNDSDKAVQATTLLPGDKSSGSLNSAEIDSDAEKLFVGPAGNLRKLDIRSKKLQPETPTRTPKRVSRSGNIQVTLSEKSAADFGETLKPTVFRSTESFRAECKVRKQIPREGLGSFDGAADDISPSRVNVNKEPPLALLLQPWLKISLAYNTFKKIQIKAWSRMGDDLRHLPHLSAQPAPLNLRKQSVEQIRAATMQRDRNHSPTRKQTSFAPASQASNKASQRHSDQRYPPGQSNTTGTTHVPGSNAFIPDTSSDIMGDFVALTTSGREDLQRSTDDDIALLNVAAKHRFPRPTENPYEFERSPLLDRLDDEEHLARFRNFMREQEVEYVVNPRTAHVKSSNSAEHGTSMTRERSPTRKLASKPSKHHFQRCESSPTISPAYHSRQAPRFQSPDSSPHFLSDDDSDEEILPPPDHQRRQGRRDATRNDRRSGVILPATTYRPDEHLRRIASRSPTRQPTQGSTHGSSSSSHYSRASKSSVDARSSSSTNARYPGLSSTKQLDDLIEDEADGTPRGFMESGPKPAKRSRSPMKKMFGEKGWLSNSPVTKSSQVPPLPNKYSTPKKPSMLGKIKNKLGEMAEKADMSPMFRSDVEKNSRETQATITRSIAPFEQARIYTELELMMVHTANVFLMNEFSQARISIDTIRKTIDSWKSKGRPMVTEFMYDQITQRNLVALNQTHFRFNGPQAGNELRISSMLYSWKQVANTMAVRTFCDTDSVILKLLFDVEHILELLGAGEPFMLRLQEISTSVKDTIRVARYKKEMEQAQKFSKGQQADAHIPHNDTPSRGRSSGHKYSDAKLPGAMYQR